MSNYIVLQLLRSIFWYILYIYINDSTADSAVLKVGAWVHDETRRMRGMSGYQENSTYNVHKNVHTQTSLRLRIVIDVAYRCL